MPAIKDNRLTNTVAFVFFIALGLVAASMAYTVYQLEIVKTALIDSLTNQEKMLDNQATGLNRSKFTLNATEDLVRKANEINGNITANIITHQSMIQNQNFGLETIYRMENMLENFTNSTDPK